MRSGNAAPMPNVASDPLAAAITSPTSSTGHPASTIPVHTASARTSASQRSADGRRTSGTPSALLYLSGEAHLACLP